MSLPGSRTRGHRQHCCEYTEKLETAALLSPPSNPVSSRTNGWSRKTLHGWLSCPRRKVVCRLLAGCLSVLLVVHHVFPATLHPLTLTVTAGRFFCPAWHTKSSLAPDAEPPESRSPSQVSGGTLESVLILEDAFAALSVLQTTYFDALNGTWPSSIDWTGAVIETVVSGMLATLTQSLADGDFGTGASWRQKENLISSVYGQVVHSFFGQNAEAIKNQAYDDMLWAVLGWLEAFRFVRLHAELHHPGTKEDDCTGLPGRLGQALQTMPWQGYRFFCTFANRARDFWDRASEGWDTTLCHGGMTWNPRLLPYKNAVTNELWISASVAMYQHFPDDAFDASWVASKGFPTKDPVYLAAAVEGYRWLQRVGMTNRQGLYVDGYHVDGSRPGNVECDIRDETVYTYNQGIILTGQRGLWSVTGSSSYLDDGHRLVRSVVEATGWNLAANAPVDIIDDLPPGELPPWRGIGRGGILEERCDVRATCSQDSQTFKGIFFHHLAGFCAAADADGSGRGAAETTPRPGLVRLSHDKACRSYVGWVKHNADAARRTRDSSGRFGMWWGAGIFHDPLVGRHDDGGAPANATDYRNDGTPLDAIWGTDSKWMPGMRAQGPGCHDDMRRPKMKAREAAMGSAGSGTAAEPEPTLSSRASDPNARGRGRTVETQMGGLALLRAHYELSRRLLDTP
ncbi:hypothetical protein RJ55_05013 [Drechmeria coniospora]|nr:hypothetical protein RJ55_05013 [Drechmeria coniospora]